MKIILQKPVDNLGEPGQIVQVADGYARNYLIPRGLAMAATKGAVKHAERLRSLQEERGKRAKAEAEALAARLAKTPVRIQVNAGDEGRIFGSITGHHVAEQVEAQLGEKIDHRDVRLEQPIRSLGAHTVTVHLHPEVDAAVTLDVAAQ
jgi:large subunit ribosomal protein L9